MKIMDQNEVKQWRLDELEILLAGQQERELIYAK